MRAEYDHTNNRVVQVENDDGRMTATHNPRVLGAKTEWLPAHVVYPDGYDARFTTLLRAMNVRYDYDEDSNQVTVHYPDADFSPEAIRNELREMIRGSARQVLNRTDWYFVRKMETGKDVPAEVVEEREAVRQQAEKFEADLGNTPDGDLTDFSFTLGTDVPNPVQAKPASPVKGADGEQWITDASAPGEQGNPVRRAKKGEVGPTVVPTRPKSGMPNVGTEEGESR
jgi:hypothetical protein